MSDERVGQRARSAEVQILEDRHPPDHSVAANPEMRGNELRGMRRVSALCATMLEHVYAATFEVEAADVRVALPRPAPWW